MKTNIHDVAEKAGVSISTVSRVINNNYPVKKETREKIEKVIEELNYKPNEVARSLILNKTSNIGIIVPGITNPFFPTIGEEIISVLRKEGFIISLFSTEGNAESEEEIIENIMSRNMDGIIIIDPSIENLKNRYFEKISKDIPLVIVNGHYKNYDLNFVSYDEEIGTRDAFRHLLNLNHKKIVFIRGDKSLSYDIKEEIYNKIVDEENLSFKEVINVGMGNSIEVIENTEKIIKNILLKDEDITAIFACNDLMALGAMNAAKSIGFSIPDDLSVIGFDNTLLSNLSTPRLTTVDLNTEVIGKLAAENLLDIINSKGQGNNIKIIRKTTLIKRETCDIARV